MREGVIIERAMAKNKEYGCLKKNAGRCGACGDRPFGSVPTNQHGAAMTQDQDQGVSLPPA